MGYLKVKKNQVKAPSVQSGFTLIEIAIVLVIIGLLLGGVLQGQQLIENSRVKSATNSFNGVAAGAFSYQDRYGRLPGDDPGAIVARGASWPAAAVGNGDGAITSTAPNTFLGAGEGGFFFQNMRSAGFIAGDPVSVGALALPQNPFGGLIGVTNDAIMPTGAGANLLGLKVCMNNVPGTSAIALDTQLDDGSGTSGRLRGVDNGAGAFVAATAGAAYNEDGEYIICYRT